MRFCPDFHQIKTFGGRLHHLHPRLLHQWDGESSKRLFSTISEQDFSQNVGEVAYSIYLIVQYMNL